VLLETEAVFVLAAARPNVYSSRTSWCYKLRRSAMCSGKGKYCAPPELW